MQALFERIHTNSTNKQMVHHRMGTITQFEQEREMLLMFTFIDLMISSREET